MDSKMLVWCRCSGSRRDLQLCCLHVCSRHSGDSLGCFECPHQVSVALKKHHKIEVFVQRWRLTASHDSLLRFSAILSSHLLGEVLNVLGKLGCLLCLLGSILLVIHAPEEQEVTSLQDMTNKLLEPGGLTVFASAEFGIRSSIKYSGVQMFGVTDSFLS